MSYDDYGISVYKLKELIFFCRQYWEKKEQIERGLSVRTAPEDRIPSGSCGQGSVTESQAMRNVILDRDCRMIEDAAFYTSRVLSDYIMRSVVDDARYEDMPGMPCGRNDFFGYKRLFFYNLMRIRDGLEPVCGAD